MLHTLLEVGNGTLQIVDIHGAEMSDELVAGLIGARFLVEADLPETAGNELKAFYDREFGGTEITCYVPGYERVVRGPLMIVGVKEDGSFRGLTQEEISRFSLLPPEDDTSNRSRRHTRLCVAPPSS